MTQHTTTSAELQGELTNLITRFNGAKSRLANCAESEREFLQKCVANAARHLEDFVRSFC